jgi:hypothetical protein
MTHQFSVFKTLFFIAALHQFPQIKELLQHKI